MIGRSLIIFQLGDNKNELHETNSWSFALSDHDSKEWDKRAISERKKKDWKPEDIVDDAEVEAICKATNCISKDRPGYHKWASDGVKVINISDDPDLPNPMTSIIAQKKKEQKERDAKIKKLEKFLPELFKLRNAITTGETPLTMTLSVKVKVSSSVEYPISSIKVMGENGKEIDYACQLIDRKTLESISELSNIIHCPHRKIFNKQCEKIAFKLGLDSGTVKNKVYDYSPKD